MSPSFGATFLQFAAPLACQALWVAPLPTVRKMKTKRSTEGLPPTGFFAMAANGYLWSMYGASAGMDLTIMLPNVTGLLAGCWYSWQFCKYDSGAFDIRVYGAMALASVVATTAIMLALAPSTARNVLGFLGCAVVVVMFVGPLQVIDRRPQAHVTEIQEEQDQLGGQPRVPFPIGAPHPLAPQRTGDQRHKGE